MKTIKIPTILGLGVLLSGLAAAVVLTTGPQIFRSQASPSFEPKEITVTNISDTSASVYWYTEKETTGFLKAGLTSTPNLTFQDERDTGNPKTYKIHFVTLRNLSPNTSYYFKIQSGAQTYPKNEPLMLQTVPLNQTNTLQPIVGTIISSTLQPVKEALITLKIPGIQPISTVTKMAGNFILPLSTLGSTNNETALLTVSDFIQNSQITFTFPPQSPILPPLTLGKNLDLTVNEASPEASFSLYDLNKDGVVNAVDLSEVVKNINKTPVKVEVDFNKDAKIDQKDLDLIKKQIVSTK